MKHLLNNLSSEERNRILEQYNNSLIVETKKFNKLLRSNLGNVKPLMEDDTNINSTSAKDNFNKSVQKLVRYMMAHDHPENEVYEKLTKIIDDKYNYFEIFQELD